MYSYQILAVSIWQINIFSDVSYSVLVWLQDWVVLGNIDLDEFIDKHLTNLPDFERNFKALKIRGRDAEKLPT